MGDFAHPLSLFFDPFVFDFVVFPAVFQFFQSFVDGFYEFCIAFFIAMPYGSFVKVPPTTW